MTERQQSFVVEVLAGSSLSGGSSLFEGGEERGGAGFSLNLFNTKMTPDLLVNKAIRESLIGGLFTGLGTGPQEAAVFRPP